MAVPVPAIPAAEKTPVQLLDVGEHQQDQRLDNFLLTRVKGVPKTLIYRIIRKGEVRVNGKRAKPDHKLDAGDKVRVPPLRLPSAKEVPQAGAQLQVVLRHAVLFEDDDLLVINKPAGLSVHGGTGVRLGLIEALRQMHPELPALELVHRLDKGTSGCILLAKTGKARKSLTEGFRQQQIHKVYHAIVAGRWPKQVKTVDASLQRQTPRGGERKVEIAEDGKAARTDFTILQRFAGATLVEARPLTGRTHQIRVHAALAGCPLLGDDKYNTDESNKLFARLGIKRLCLHAAEVSFRHPVTNKMITVKAAYDAAFANALSLLGEQ